MPLLNHSFHHLDYQLIQAVCFLAFNVFFALAYHNAGGDNTEPILLAAATSADIFAAAMGLRGSGIKFSPLSSAAAALAGALVLCLSAVMSSAADEILPLDKAVYISKVILAVMGIRALFGDVFPKKGKKSRKFAFPDCIGIMNNPAAADTDNSKTISPAEGAALGAALSVDSFFTGLGAGAAKMPPLPIFAASFVFGLAAAALGTAAGKYLSRQSVSGFPTGRIGAIMLIILAIII